MADDDGQRPLLKRRGVWISAALIVIVAVVAGIAFLPGGEETSTNSREEDSTSSSSPRLPLPSPTPGSDVDPLGRPVVVPSVKRGVAFPQSDQNSSTDAANPLPRPKGLEWQRVYGGPVPFSSSDGPRTVTDQGIPTGMAQTPQGAVIAALQLLSRVRYGTTSDRYAVVDSRIIATAEEKQSLKDDGDIQSFGMDDGSPYGESLSTQVLVPAGFRIRPGNWTKDAATVDIAYGPQSEEDESGAPQSVYYWRSLSVVWVSGEWSLRFKESMFTQEDREGSMGSLDSGEWATWIS